MTATELRDWSVGIAANQYGSGNGSSSLRNGSLSTRTLNDLMANYSGLAHRNGSFFPNATTAFDEKLANYSQLSNGSGLLWNASLLVKNTTALGDDGCSSGQIAAHVYLAAKLQLAIAALGILANLSFIYTLYRIPAMKQLSTNVYLLNLALVDLLFLLFKASMESAALVGGDRLPPLTPFSVIRCDLPVCELVQLFYCLPLYTSVFILTLIAAERHAATCYPLQAAHLLRRSLSVRLTALAWALAGLFLAVRLLYCHFSDWDRRAFVAVHMAPFCAAFLATGLCYGRVAVALQARSRHSAYSASTQHHVRRTSRQVVLMMVVSTCCFFACITPYQLNMVQSLDGSLFSAEGADALYVVYNLCLVVYASANPVIYGLCSRKYRKAFRAAFFGRRGRRPSASLGQIHARLVERRLAAVTRIRSWRLRWQKRRGCSTATLTHSNATTVTSISFHQEVNCHRLATPLARLNSNTYSTQL